MYCDQRILQMVLPYFPGFLHCDLNPDLKHIIFETYALTVAPSHPCRSLVKKIFEPIVLRQEIAACTVTNGFCKWCCRIFLLFARKLFRIAAGQFVTLFGLKA